MSKALNIPGDSRKFPKVLSVCSPEVDLEDFVARPDKISAADINSICQEAGMQAVRENRYVVLAKDFEKAYMVVIKKDDSAFEFYK